MIRFGFARGHYAARPDDGLALVGCRIVNAVRCVPPENKPTPAEIGLCNPFLANELDHLPNLRAVLALGSIAHAGVLTALGRRKSALKFAHGAEHAVRPDLTLFDSYHCSRYNTNTGRLTSAMFAAVVGRIRQHLPL